MLKSKRKYLVLQFVIHSRTSSYLWPQVTVPNTKVVWACFKMGSFVVKKRISGCTHMTTSRVKNSTLCYTFLLILELYCSPLCLKVTALILKFL